MRLLLPICLIVLVASTGASAEISMHNFLERIINNSTLPNITLPCTVFSSKSACARRPECFWNSALLACEVPQILPIVENGPLSSSLQDQDDIPEYIRNATGPYYGLNHDGNTTIYDHNQVNQTGYINDQINNTAQYNSSQSLNQFSNQTWYVDSQVFSNGLRANETLDHVNWYYLLANKTDFNSNVTAPDIQWSQYRPNNGSTIVNATQEWAILSIGDINNNTQIMISITDDNSTKLEDETVNSAFEFVLNTTSSIETTASDELSSFRFVNQTQIAWQNNTQVILIDGIQGNSTNNSSSIQYNGTDNQTKNFFVSDNSTVVESSSEQNNYFVYYNPTTENTNSVHSSAKFTDKYTAPQKEAIPSNELTEAPLSCSNIIDQKQCQLNGCIWKIYHRICLSVKEGRFVEAMLAKTN